MFIRLIIYITLHCGVACEHQRMLLHQLVAYNLLNPEQQINEQQKKEEQKNQIKNKNLKHP